MTTAATNSASTRARRLQFLVAAFALLLTASTWRLWIAQDVYPQIPFLQIATACTGWLDALGCVLFVTGWAGQLVCAWRTEPGGTAHRWSVIATLAGFALLVILDQHRLQPWAYHFVLVSLTLGFVRPSRRLNLLRWLTVAIYVHSALSKLDYSFMTTHGQSLVWGLLQNVSLQMDGWSESARRAAALSLPAGELLVAVLLLIPGSRTVGCGLSWVMHGLLIAAVGPWGLNHQPAVIGWNVYFLIQNGLLFWRSSQKEQSPAASAGENQAPALPQPRHDAPAGSLTGLAAETAIWAAMLLPPLEPWERFDTWPSWGLYASRPARAEVFVHREARARITGPAANFIAEPRDASPWCLVRVDRWSLAALNAPVYPQDRFALGTALALSEAFGLESDIRVALFGAADRLTGERTARELIGTEALRREAAERIVNCFPREGF